MKKIFLILIFFLLLFISILNFYFWWTKNKEYQNLKQSLFQKEITIKELEALLVEKEKTLQIQAQGTISVLIRNNQESEILFGKNIDKELPIASLVKLITAHVVLRYYDLNYKIEISEEAILQPGDSGNLKKGQKFSVKDLLFPLLIESSNDAAFALTEIIGQEEFVYLMNSEAERLGLKNTFFINPSGLDSLEPTKPVSYSTAQDLVKFTKYLLNFNKDNNKLLLWDILSTKKINFYGQTLINTNELLNEIPEIVGGKTGWTSRASGSLLLVLEVPEGYLINIILGTSTLESRFEEMRKLIDLIKRENSILGWREVPTTIPWPTRDSHGTVVFKDKLWLMGGLNGNNFVRSPGSVRYGDAPHFSDIWVSENGINWNLVTDRAPWGKRRSIQTVVFQDKIWVIPGWGPETGIKNDIWNSEDGIHWNLVNSNPNFPAREGHQLVVFEDKLWLIGGVNYNKRKVKNDVWYSENGKDWFNVTVNAAWSVRWDHEVVVFKDRLWLTGGMDLKNNVFGDVWVSRDGKNWTLINNNPPWAERQGHEMIVFKDKIWLIGRFHHDKRNDIWNSEDGINWKKINNNPDLFGREDFTAVVFKDKIWIMGGMDINWTWRNDIWYSK